MKVAENINCMVAHKENTSTFAALTAFFSQAFHAAEVQEAPLMKQQAEEVPLLWRTPVSATAAVSDPVIATVAQVRPSIQLFYLALDHRAVLRWHAHHKPAPDALFLHRPFLLPPHIWPDVPVFASHKGFDERFTLGYNPLVAQLLGLGEPDTALVREDKGGVRVGMVADVLAPTLWGDWREKIAGQFGGLEMSVRPVVTASPITRVAVVGAMTPALIADATTAGAQAYITGQFRETARSEATKQGIGILAVGHRRSEIWGLHQLTRELSETFPGLNGVVIE